MLIASEIRKNYGKKTILKSISLTVAPGQSMVIAGHNGCGKTTLLRILAGAMKADGGSLSFFGNEAMCKGSGKPEIFRRFTGFVPQDDPLLQELTVEDNLSLFAAKDGTMTEYRNELYENFGLCDMIKKPVGELSGGMKRRVSIACALINRPPILIMDEPTSALDIYYKEETRELLRSYLLINGTVIFSSHEDSEIKGADRCMLMSEGTLSEVEGPAEDRLIYIKKHMYL